EDPVPGATGPTRVLLVPAFNEIAGYDIRHILRKPFAPVSKYLKEDGVEIILADGSYFGPASMLKADDDDD
ncbi:MAG TPA: phosphoesterase, partial [Methanoregula sp.]|nr:phosphoesterase [Methanoregula sp.]